MGAFREFEVEVLHLLVAPQLGRQAVDDLVTDAEVVSYNYSGCGYFLTVRHVNLPTGRIVYSQPKVTGRVGDIQSGFVVFIEGGELMLECHTCGAIDVPEDFREQRVVVTAG